MEVFEGFWDTIGRFDSIHPAATPEKYIIVYIYKYIYLFIYVFSSISLYRLVCEYPHLCLEGTAKNAQKRIKEHAEIHMPNVGDVFPQF